MAEEEKAIALRAKNLILKQGERLQTEKKMEQKQRGRKLMRLHLSNILGSFLSTSAVFVVGILIGGAIFINVPEGVGCDRDNVLCQKMRFRQPKITYD